MYVFRIEIAVIMAKKKNVTVLRNVPRKLQAPQRTPFSQFLPLPLSTSSNRKAA